MVDVYSCNIASGLYIMVEGGACVRSNTGRTSWNGGNGRAGEVGFGRAIALPNRWTKVVYTPTKQEQIFYFFSCLFQKEVLYTLSGNAS